MFHKMVVICQMMGNQVIDHLCQESKVLNLEILIIVPCLNKEFQVSNLQALQTQFVSNIINHDKIILHLRELLIEVLMESKIEY